MVPMLLTADWCSQPDDMPDPRLQASDARSYYDCYRGVPLPVSGAPNCIGGCTVNCILDTILGPFRTRFSAPSRPTSAV